MLKRIVGDLQAQHEGSHSLEDPQVSSCSFLHGWHNYLSSCPPPINAAHKSITMPFYIVLFWWAIEADIESDVVPAPGPDRFGSQDRFGGEFPPFAEDPTLFPPPPSARSSQPPPPPPPRTEGLSDSTHAVRVDPEREAFLAQLDSLAQDLEKVT